MKYTLPERLAIINNIEAMQTELQVQSIALFNLSTNNLINLQTQLKELLNGTVYNQ